MKWTLNTIQNDMDPKRGEEGQPHQSIFLKNVFIFKDRTLKKNNIERTRISRWLGRENEENVARTRD